MLDFGGRCLAGIEEEVKTFEGEKGPENPPAR
jgi:hypothetical protein